MGKPKSPKYELARVSGNYPLQTDEHGRHFYVTDNGGMVVLEVDPDLLAVPGYKFDQGTALRTHYELVEGEGWTEVGKQVVAASGGHLWAGKAPHHRVKRDGYRVTRDIREAAGLALMQRIRSYELMIDDPETSNRDRIAALKALGTIAMSGKEEEGGPSKGAAVVVLPAMDPPTQEAG